MVEILSYETGKTASALTYPDLVQLIDNPTLFPQNSGYF